MHILKFLEKIVSFRRDSPLCHNCFVIYLLVLVIVWLDTSHT